MTDIQTRGLKLTSFEGDYAICQLNAQTSIPQWASMGELYSITRTPDELSIICLHEQIPDHIPCQAGWRVLKIEGPFSFDEIGVLAALTTPLAAAQISLLTVSTFDTDYILIQAETYDQARQVLQAAGHQVD